MEIEGWSVEDNGAGICFNVFCYNVQPYIDIDYLTGDSSVSADAPSTVVFDDTEATTEYIVVLCWIAGRSERAGIHALQEVPKGKKLSGA